MIHMKHLMIKNQSGNRSRACSALPLPPRQTTLPNPHTRHGVSNMAGGISGIRALRGAPHSGKKPLAAAPAALEFPAGSSAAAAAAQVPPLRAAVAALPACLIRFYFRFRLYSFLFRLYFVKLLLKTPLKGHCLWLL